MVNWEEEIDSRQDLLNEQILVAKKERDFYDMLKSQEYSSTFDRIAGSYEKGILIYGRDYSLVDNFSISQESANLYAFLRDTTESMLGVLEFFNDVKFKDFKAKYKLEDKEIVENRMNVIYSLHVDDRDYSGTPCSPTAPHFRAPVKLSDMKDFYLSKGMNKDLVSKVIERVSVVRSALGC